MDMETIKEKRTVVKLVFGLVIGGIFFLPLSCRETEMNLDPAEQIPEEVVKRHDNEIYFAKTLAKAVQEEKAIRDFIKDRSLEMFDKDYDVLYHMIKNMELSTGETFQSALYKYADSRQNFDDAVANLPLLNILVPKLPDGFSAPTWDTDSQVPYVAVARREKGDVPIYG